MVLTLCHPLDYLRWLLGETSAVHATLDFNSELGLSDVEDSAEITLKYMNGVTGSVHLNYNQRPPVHKMQLVGSEGTIEWNGLDGNLRVFTGEMGKWKSYPLDADFSRNDLFMSEMKHFLRVINGDEEPVCSLEDGMVIQKLIHDIKRSHQEGILIEHHPVEGDLLE